MLAPMRNLFRHPILGTVLASLGAAACLRAAEFPDSNWPQFRGPNGAGTAAGAKPPERLSTTNDVLWKIDMPWSASSPAVWGGRVFVTTFADGELQTRCLAKEDGRQLWSRGVKPESVEVFHRTEGSPAASTPATDGKRVVSYFGSFGLVCHGMEGKELWRHPLPVAISGGRFGSGTSPIIAGEAVILNRDLESGSSVMAISLANGKTLWETPRPLARGSFGTPIVWNNNGTREVVTPGSVRLNGYDLKTGAERWMFEGVCSFSCTTPVVGDGLLFFGAWSPGKSDSPWPTWATMLGMNDKNGDGQLSLSEFGESDRDFARGMDFDHDGVITKSDYDQLAAHIAKGENVLVAIKPGGRGDITKTHSAWDFTRGLPYVPSPLYYEGRIYLMRDGMVTCLDAKTGAARYTQERINANGNYYASPVAADGRLIFVSQAGRATVVKAGGEKPEVLSQADFGERIFATPALAGPNVYLRTESKIYAFGKRGN